MRLTPLTNYAERKTAFEELHRVLRQDAMPVECTVGWPGGSRPHTVFWREDAGFWSLLIERQEKFWCPFGTSRPEAGKNVSETCEINPPAKATHRRMGGLFLRDEKASYYLAHTGKIGVGRAGIGKSRFLEQYSGPLEQVEWPDGRRASVILLGRIGAPNFFTSLAHYIRSVQSFKTR